MQNDIKRVFDNIKASDELKQKTYVYLQGKMKKRKRNVINKYTASFASIVLLISVGIFGYFFYMTETAVLDIDVNPSIELSLNRFDRVVGMHAYNEDGSRILNGIDIQNKSYQDALSAIINEMTEAGYIKEEGRFTATLMTDGKKDSSEKLNELKDYINMLLEYDTPSVQQEVFSVDSTTKEHAHQENITPAKYLAILELQEVDPSVSIDECRDHSIDEIKQQTHSHQNGHSNEMTASDATPGQNNETQDEKAEEDISSASEDYHEKNGGHGKH